MAANTLSAGESRLTVVTGWGPGCFESYARNFVKTFRAFFPADTRLLAYVENETPDAAPAEQISLWACDGMKSFLDRHRDVPAHNGRFPATGWKEKDKVRGYNFRFDAWKFSRMAYIPHHAAGI